MENKEQIKETKSRKKGKKSDAAKASVRINSALRKRADEILVQINNKKFGRSVKFDDLLALLLEQFQEDHVEVLREKSMTGKDRKEQLRRKYIEVHGHVSEAEFTEIQTTPKYQEFMLAQGFWKRAA